jgi:tRNA uridine 5-carboxymethylaminomethyl modification enzyme
MAGINAGLQVRGETPLVLSRSDAYIGILVDDLVTKGTSEPYRMFTSRAEFRLNLRIDNADRRLTPIGRKAGVVGDAQWQQYRDRQQRLERLTSWLATAKADPAHEFFTARGIDVRERPLLTSVVRRPEVRLGDLVAAGIVDCENLRREDMISIETAIKYEGYLKQQEREVEKLRQAEAREIPAGLDYAGMPGLSREIVEKLSRVQPRTLAQAGRIPGITPASLSIVLFHMEFRR